MSSRFVPEAGDIVWLSLDPRAGHEQAGHRPALVLTSARYNGRSGLMIACPMTSRIKGYPFEVVLSQNPPSVVLADQARNMDWEARGATFKGKASPVVLAETRAKLKALLDL